MMPEQMVWRTFAALCASFMAVASLAFLVHGIWELVETPNGPWEDALGMYMLSFVLGIPIAVVLTLPVAALVFFRWAGLLSVLAMCAAYACWMVLLFAQETPQEHAWSLLGVATFLWPYPLLSWLFFWGAFAPAQQGKDGG